MWLEVKVNTLWNLLWCNVSIRRYGSCKKLLYSVLPRYFLHEHHNTLMLHHTHIVSLHKTLIHPLGPYGLASWWLCFLEHQHLGSHSLALYGLTEMHYISKKYLCVCSSEESKWYNIWDGLRAREWFKKKKNSWVDYMSLTVCWLSV